MNGNFQDFRGSNAFENLQKFSIKGFRDVRKIVSAGDGDRFVGFPVSGDSLKHLGILHGDLLITKLTDRRAEEKLSVWETLNGRTAKFGYENFGEIVLHNKGDWRRTYKTDEVKLLGVVARVERDL